MNMNDMTNEEKATELVGYVIDTPIECFNIEARDNYFVLMKMAEWKDAQFKEYLKKKKAELGYRSDLIGLSAPFCAKLIDELINDF